MLFTCDTESKLVMLSDRISTLFVMIVLQALHRNSHNKNGCSVCIYYRFYWMMWSVQEMRPAYCTVHTLHGVNTIVFILRTQLLFALVIYFMSTNTRMF